MIMNMIEKKIDGEVIYDGKIIRVERDRVLCPNGRNSYREVVRHNGGAAILCITKDDRVLLERQFRYPYNEVIYEIPAGKLEKGEDPYQAAQGAGGFRGHGRDQPDHAILMEVFLVF